MVLPVYDSFGFYIEDARGIDVFSYANLSEDIFA